MIDSRPMANAHYGLNFRMITRGQGHSVVQAGAYQSGERLTDHIRGITYDYAPLNRTRESTTMATALLVPESAGEWARDRESFYNTIEATCTAKNAQLARWARMNIPREVPAERRMELVTSFVQREFVNRGMCADVALQACKASDGLENPHAHVILTMRHIMPDGSYAKKAGLGREWNDLFTKGWQSEIRAEGFANTKGSGDGFIRNTKGLETFRARWAAHVNQFLEESGANARCSHLSHEARGFPTKAQPYIGKAKFNQARNSQAHAAVQKITLENRLTLARRYNHSGKARVEAEAITRAEHARVRASQGRSHGQQWCLEDEWSIDR